MTDEKSLYYCCLISTTQFCLPVALTEFLHPAVASTETSLLL